MTDQDLLEAAVKFCHERSKFTLGVVSDRMVAEFGAQIRAADAEKIARMDAELARLTDAMKRLRYWTDCFDWKGSSFEEIKLIVASALANTKTGEERE